MEREQVKIGELLYEKAGHILQELCRKHPTIKISGSLGISPLTDEILVETFQPDINEMQAIIGDDWYPIIGFRVKPGMTNEGLGATAECPNTMIDKQSEINR
ncbi:MAG TPA: hypothetical protein VLK23_21520 [Thermodesulfobacteriota bacterium]|nr:hypothetical protein [Thermodesulfobacteriota bacterium]